MLEEIKKDERFQQVTTQAKIAATNSMLKTALPERPATDYRHNL